MDLFYYDTAVSERQRGTHLSKIFSCLYSPACSMPLNKKPKWLVELSSTVRHTS